MDRTIIQRCARSQIYWITPCLTQGRFPTQQRCADLRDAGITHVLNVSDAPFPAFIEQAGFRQIRWLSTVDLQRIPNDHMIRCIEALHSMTSFPDATVYIHCTAGENRSPTILWLYLIACGVIPDVAKRMIESRNFDAIAGHKLLSDTNLVDAAQQYGKENFLPLGRPEIIVPIE